VSQSRLSYATRPAVVIAEDSGRIRLSHGVLVAFEGIDGAGKTTQARLLARHLRDAGLSVVETKEPTSGPHGQRLRASAISGRLKPEDELAAFIEDRRDHVERVIEPSLRDGRVVIVDRYYFSTAAYQGARGFEPEPIIAVNETFAPAPDLLVLLDIPVEEALRRIGARENGNGGANEFEKPTTLELCAAIFRRLKRPYLLLLDGCAPVAEIHERVVLALDNGPLRAAPSVGRIQSKL
jgi:dTMP kinase